MEQYQIDHEMILIIGRNIYEKYSDAEILIEAVDLLVKAISGVYLYHTGERFLNSIRLLNKNKTLNVAGREFLYTMLSKISGGKSLYIQLSEEVENGKQLLRCD
jgi:hypothetical protein